MLKKTKHKIAVVGATGSVGRTMLQILSDAGVAKSRVVALASPKSAGREISYGEDDILKVQPLPGFDFSTVDIALSSPGGKVSAEFAPKAAAQGCVVIDNTSHFRMDEDVPLVVPEVNPEALSDYGKRNIISNPNCSTIQMVMALKPIHDVVGIKRVIACTYQSVSGAGKQGMDELTNQTKGLFVGQQVEPNVFQKVIAFNTIPQIDHFMDDGKTREEWKMVVETHKILDPAIEVSVTCARVPVFIGHSVAVHIECKEPITANEARKVMNSFPGVQVYDRADHESYATPAEVAGEDPVFVSRVRVDSALPNGLAMWIVADNVRKGAALNTCQIADILVEKYL